MSLGDDVAEPRVIRSGHRTSHFLSDLSTFASIMKRRRRSFIIAVLLSMMAGTIYVCLARPIFTATAILSLNVRQKSSMASHADQETFIDPATIDSQLVILNSERIASKVVDDLGLAAHPEVEAPIAAWTTRMHSLLGLRDPAHADQQDGHMKAVATIMRERKIDRIKNSFFAEISVTTNQPALSAQIANAIADNYIQDQMESNVEIGKRNLSMMVDHIEAAKKQLNEAILDRDRVEKMNGETISGGELSTTDRVAALAARVDVARLSLQNLQHRAIILTDILDSRSLPITDARVLDRAEVPVVKQNMRASLILLLSSCFGIAGGVAAALLRELMDRKIWSREQVVRSFHPPLPVIACMAPQLESDPSPSKRRDVEYSGFAVTERLRTIKLLIDRAPKIGKTAAAIGFVSPCAGDESADVAFVSAKMLADIGMRVLVIEALRLCSILGEPKNPSKSHDCCESLDHDAILRSRVETTEAGVDILTRLPYKVSSQMMRSLSSESMRLFLMSARSAYDYVFVVVPPLIDSIGSEQMVSFLDGCMLVTTQGSTTIDDAHKALAILDEVGSRPLAFLISSAKTHDTSRTWWSFPSHHVVASCMASKPS